MRIGIRADGGKGVGLGHLGRCLALAEAFAHFGEKPVFLDVAPECRQWVAERGFPMRRWEGSKRDILVADSYRFSRADMSAMRRDSNALLVLDDLGNYPGPCDWILNGHCYARSLAFRASPGASLLLGPRFLPMRREYWTALPSRPARSSIGRILIALGGNGIGRAADAITRITRQAYPLARISMVAGPLTKKSPAIPGIRWLASLPSLLPFIAEADLGISGGGQTAYEFARCGTPFVAVTIADNQGPNVSGLVECGVALAAGSQESQAFPTSLRRALGSLRDARRRARISGAGRRLLDGQGALRVAGTLLGRRCS
jgi:spore coat polysaccharide biosynthesis predicted glycosyltransferase SpsG